MCNPGKILCVLAALGLLIVAAERSGCEVRVRPSRLPAADAPDLSLLTEESCAISIYDNLFRSISEAEGNDWRLVSAIAYHESRFTPTLRSPRGARGIMQLRPSVARQLGVNPDCIGDLCTNIRLANRYINTLARMLGLPRAIADDDRLRILLAAYNGGVGHVLDARQLARDRGENPDSWTIVKRYLRLKSAEPDYYEDDGVGSGQFTGYAETAAYVAAVCKRYELYCARVAR